MIQNKKEKFSMKKYISLFINQLGYIILSYLFFSILIYGCSYLLNFPINYLQAVTIVCLLYVLKAFNNSWSSFAFLIKSIIPTMFLLIMYGVVHYAI